MFVAVMAINARRRQKRFAGDGVCPVSGASLVEMVAVDRPSRRQPAPDVGVDDDDSDMPEDDRIPVSLSKPVAKACIVFVLVSFAAACVYDVFHTSASTLGPAATALVGVIVCFGAVHFLLLPRYVSATASSSPRPPAPPVPWTADMLSFSGVLLSLCAATAAAAGSCNGATLVEASAAVAALLLQVAAGVHTVRWQRRRATVSVTLTAVAVVLLLVCLVVAAKASCGWAAAFAVLAGVCAVVNSVVGARRSTPGFARASMAV